jgi:hypothetical protein
VYKRCVTRGCARASLLCEIAPPRPHARLKPQLCRQLLKQCTTSASTIRLSVVVRHPQQQQQRQNSNAAVSHTGAAAGAISSSHSLSSNPPADRDLCCVHQVRRSRGSCGSDHAVCAVSLVLIRPFSASAGATTTSNSSSRAHGAAGRCGQQQQLAARARPRSRAVAASQRWRTPHRHRHAVCTALDGGAALSVHPWEQRWLAGALPACCVACMRRRVSPIPQRGAAAHACQRASTPPPPPPQGAVVTPPADPYALPPPRGHLPSHLTLYQYEVCPFCCKVKAFLDYNKVRVCVCVCVCGGGGGGGGERGRAVSVCRARAL